MAAGGVTGAAGAGRAAPAVRWWGLVTVSTLVVATAVPAGYALTRWALSSPKARYLPWIAGRSLGLAAFAALTALVALGTWSRHPWRLRRKVLHPETVLRAHVALAAATIVLLAGHIVSLVLDRYAGVGWRGMLVPGAATYRPAGVALGVIALYLLVLVTGTAVLAGRLIGRSWLRVHRVGFAGYALVWVHGVLSGADTPRLEVVYALSGLFVVALAGTRLAAGQAGAASRPMAEAVSR